MQHKRMETISEANNEDIDMNYNELKALAFINES